MIFIILAEIFNHKDFAMDINYECKNTIIPDTNPHGNGKLSTQAAGMVAGQVKGKDDNVFQDA